MIQFETSNRLDEKKDRFVRRRHSFKRIIHII